MTLDPSVIAIITTGTTALFGLGFAVTAVKLTAAERKAVRLESSNELLSAANESLTNSLTTANARLRDQGRTIAEYRAKEPVRGAGGKFARKAA
jgi:hypothetical protein